MLQLNKSHGVPWAQGVPEMLRLEAMTEQLQLLRQAVPNSQCGSSKSMVANNGILGATQNNYNNINNSFKTTHTYAQKISSTIQPHHSL